MPNVGQLLFGPASGQKWIFILLIAAWSLFWKGLALWRAAKKNQNYWFAVLLVVNTLGIFEIIYLAFFQKKGKGKLESKPPTQKKSK